MLSKKTVYRIVDDHLPDLLENLGINPLEIDVRVQKSTQRVQLLIGSEESDPGCHGATLFSSEEPFPIVLLYNDIIPDEYDALGTLVHELIHIKMRPLLNEVSKKRELKAEALEESIVRSLEKLIMKVWQGSH